MKKIPILLLALFISGFFISGFFIACKSDEERCQDGDLNACSKVLVKKSVKALEGLKNELSF